MRVNIGDIFGSEGIGSIFDDLINGGGRGRGGVGFRSRGQDVETAITLPFQEAIAGATLTLAQGTKVRVPPGVGDGARIKVAGKGEMSPGGGPPGDLYVRVQVEPHPIFTTRKGGDLMVTLPVTFTEAALGAKVEVPTLGDPVTVKVPAGTSSGKVLRVKGRGAPRSKQGNGDLLVRIEVHVPQKLSGQEKEVLERLAEIHDGSPRDHLKPYLRPATADAS